MHLVDDLRYKYITDLYWCCCAQVRQYNLDRVLVKGTVDRIIPVLSGKEVLHFRVLTRDGETVEAKRVVLATGPTRAQMANIPAWVQAIGESYPEESLQHTVQLMHHLPLLHQKQQQQQQAESPTQEGPYPSPPGTVVREVSFKVSSKTNDSILS